MLQKLHESTELITEIMYHPVNRYSFKELEGIFGLNRAIHRGLHIPKKSVKRANIHRC